MIRMMVGFMGSEASSIFSRVIPMMDSSTMTRSSWFHLHKSALVKLPSKIKVISLSSEICSFSPSVKDLMVVGG